MTYAVNLRNIQIFLISLLATLKRTRRSRFVGTIKWTKTTYLTFSTCNEQLDSIIFTFNLSWVFFQLNTHGVISNKLKPYFNSFLTALFWKIVLALLIFIWWVDFPCSHIYAHINFLDRGSFWYTFSSADAGINRIEIEINCVPLHGFDHLPLIRKQIYLSLIQIFSLNLSKYLQPANILFSPSILYFFFFNYCTPWSYKITYWNSCKKL